MARVKIAEFGIIQKMLGLATVTFFVADENGENSGVKAEIFQEASGTGQRENPQTLDEDGKLTTDCYVEARVVATITGISDRTERSLKKIRQNPNDYNLPVTSAAFISAVVSQAEETAVDAAAEAAASETAAAASAAAALTSENNASTSETNSATSAANALVSENNAAASAAAAAASASGMKWRPSVRAATTGNITLSGAQTIDGVSVVAGNRVLVRAQSSSAENGVYVAAAGAWSRATDADTWDELVAQTVVVEEGSTLADALYVCTVNSGGTLGVTAVTWSQLGLTVIPDGSITPAKLDRTYQEVNPRVQTVASAATVTPTNLNDIVTITAQAVALAIANPSGSMVEGQALTIRIKDNGTARAISWGTNYRALGASLPTTTVISKQMYVYLIWNATDTKFDVTGVSQEA